MNWINILLIICLFYDLIGKQVRTCNLSFIFNRNNFTQNKNQYNGRVCLHTVLFKRLKISTIGINTDKLIEEINNDCKIMA